MFDNYNSTGSIHYVNYIDFIFQNNSSKAPEDCAVIDRNGQRSLTWGELRRGAVTVAALAAERKLSGVVPVCMSRCAETVVTLFGLGLAGIGVAPLSDHTPEERIRLIEEQSGNSAWREADYEAAMLREETDRGTAKRWEAGGDVSVPGKARPFRAVPFAEDMPAYVVFTSGSTGMPKGVMLSNEAVVKSCMRIADRDFMDLSPEDVALQSASFSFVILLNDLYAPLYRGCVCHILPEEARLDMGLMTDYINAHGITALFTTPKILSRLGDAPSLRAVCVGGERVSGLGPKGYRLMNAWGMSETAAMALGYPVKEPMEETPIGTPRGDFRTYVVDENGVLSEEGELCLSGPVALGYYKQPELTAQLFVPNPFSGESGHTVLMHTGDIVRRLPDGNLLYLNRKDFMIKINGQRVEPGEAEAVLKRLDGVKDAAVTGFTEPDGRSYLCAFYVTEDSAAESRITEGALLEEMKKQLPSYMIPAFYIKLDALPLNANGKLDRKALPKPRTETRQGHYTEAATETEEKLCRAFETVLKLERAGAEDDFLLMGGDSIRAMSVVSLAGIPGLRGFHILSGRTPRGIAALLQGASDALYEDLPEDLPRAPLTDSQMGLYLECAERPESTMYNIPVHISFARATRTGEQLTGKQVKTAVDNVLRRHPALLSHVEVEGDRFYMVRSPMPEAGICTVVETDEAGVTLALEHPARPFDLSRSPLCRASVLLTDSAVHILMDLHHIVSDGTSVSILTRQICAALSGEELKPEKVDAFALREAERRLLAGEAAGRAEEHFRNLLSGMETDSNLLFDRKPQEKGTVLCRRVVRRFDALDLSALKAKGITESTFFMGVYGYTLAKMTGQTNSLFAAVESGRRSALLDNTVSMLVRTLPVTMEISETKPASELLSTLQKQFFASVEHDCASFGTLSREYGVKSDVLFVYQSDMLSGFDCALGHVTVEGPETGNAFANLSASVFRDERGYLLNLEYRTDCYNASTINRFAEVYAATAESFADDRPLSQIPLLSEDDRAFLDSVNRTDEPITDETLVDIFRRVARQQPEKTLVVSGGVRYTYAEADDLTDRLAAELSAWGIGKDSVVSILIPRCEYMVLASLGVMKAGAIYQPLDPSYPSERLTFMTKDADSALLIADRSLTCLLPDYDRPVLITDEIPALPEVGMISPAAGTVPPADETVSSTDVAVSSIDGAVPPADGTIPAADRTVPPSPAPEDSYILLYTSGTTGTPKGCALTHRNLTALSHAYRRVTAMDGSCRIAAYASYGFDAHMSDIYPAITCGAEIHIIQDSIRLDLPAIKDYLADNGITHMLMTTQLARQFTTQYHHVGAMRVLLCGGEKLVSFEPEADYAFYNAYGPTECTVMSAAFRVDRLYDDIPIGRPIANTRLYVVDPFNRRVPVGVPGELIIAGPQVAKGYLNREEQTAKVFVPNTFEEGSVTGYERCYRTGDIVRYLEDGNLVFIGRRDQQVKIRGFRIELGEVERVIRTFPGITDATVIAGDAPGGKCLYAYVVSDQKINVEELNSFIRAEKPPYMVPAATMQLDSIPLTVNGKVDKRKLPKPEVKFDDVTKPETELQKKIFDKATEAIGAEGFGIHTDLFLAGLSSLSSIRLCSLLAEEFGISMQIRALKKNETVAKLEAYIKAELEKKNHATGAVAESGARSGSSAATQKKPEVIRYAPDHPISRTMEGIFAECVRKPDSTFYNIPYLLKLSPEIDAERLKKALAEAVEAHPAMKAELFTDDEGRIRQHRRMDDRFTAEEIRELWTDSIESVRNNLVTVFPITGSRLFTVTLIRADTLYLALNIHHIIADGTSVVLFLRDVEKAYAGAALTEERYNGFDVAEDEAEARNGDDLTEAKAYYENLLEGRDKDFLPLPDRLPDTDAGSGHLLRANRLADSGQIRRFCEESRVSMNAFFISVFGLVLSRYAGTGYSVFNTVYNGRNDSRTADTFAMLVKTLPVVCSTEKDTPAALVSAMASQLMDSMANDLYSYGEIARSLGVKNDVMFIFQGDSFSRNRFCGAPAEELTLELSENKTAMTLQVMLNGGGLVYDFSYDPDRFTERLAEAFVDAFDTACASFPAVRKLSDVQLLSPEEERDLERYNETGCPYDRTRTVTDFFLEQVKKQPEHLCVAYNNVRRSFAEVEELSGKVAKLLMTEGIGTGDVVSILIRRDDNMVITAHGALRTGAAYLGLDPTYPADRLMFMIQDSGSRYLIADRTLTDRIPGYSGKILYTDEIGALPSMTEAEERKFAAQEKHRITPENDALIIYSSGTTGTPKGSVLRHRNIVCFYHNYARDVELGPDARVAAYASFGFDGGAQDVFCCPMSGSALYIIPDEIRMDLSSLEQFYVRNAITAGFMTTQVGCMFISSTRCRSLKHFTVGGEKLVPCAAPEWVKFRNCYGPSESMCYVNSFRVLNTGALQPIGKVSRNMKEYIIDRSGRRLPFGACGELCISGGQLGRGYLNRPEKTSEVFVPNLFSTEEGYETMYRTGDMARLLPDGNYDFVGRRDGQVKIRGFRVELSEVEQQVRKFPGVTNTVVTAPDSPAGGKYLACYVVMDRPLAADELRSFIAAEKPDYMVPAAIMQVEEIPLTSNGKVDYRKLPKPAPGAVRKGAEPADETEEKICAIFSEVLGLEKVYADDDYFSIGGSSISAIQVIVKCGQAGLPIVYKNLFANPTAQKLSAFLRGGQREDVLAEDLEKGDGHDYSCLKYNTVEHLREIRNNGVGDVLLTGATGFLGSHVFRELLTSTSGKVICVVRSKPDMSAETRLEMMMVYYFEDWYTTELSARVTVIDGDLEDDGTQEKLKEIHFDTVINCAANVKHFAAGDELLNANFAGVENLIRLAEVRNAKLIQISSLSVCGESVNGSVPAGYLFRETDLNIGQSLENKYIYTKYLAEQAVIDATSRKRIRGKVIRLGNLMARLEDSEFQVNAGTNGFIRGFLGFGKLGCFPLGMMDSAIEFSPIDQVARAVVLLAGTPDSFTVFHAKNCNTIHFGYFTIAIQKAGKPIEIVEDEVFEQRLNEALAKEENVEELGGLLAYRNSSGTSLTDTLKYSGDRDLSAESETRLKISSDTTFTTKALYRLGFAWPLITNNYLEKMVEVLKEMNFFN